MRIGMLAAVAMAAGVLSVSSAAAQSDNLPAEEPTENAIVVHMRGPAPTRALTSAALLVKAQAEGEVRVIVELALTLRDEDGIAASEAASQARTLRAMQDGLLTRVLGAAAAGNDRVVRFSFIPFVSIYVNADQLSRLLAEGQVVTITEDVPKRPMLSDSVPLIKADKLWAKNYRGSGSSIAILDTGVDKSHVTFFRKVVSEACYSIKQGANKQSLCPGGATSSTAVGSGVNCPAGIAGCDHGTHVASIAGGTGNSIFDVPPGVAKGANIIAIQVFHRENRKAKCKSGKAPCALSDDTNIISGMERAYSLRKTHKVAAVNLSVGGGKYGSFCDDYQPPYWQSFDKLLNAGILVTVASGNDSYKGYMSAPACISKAVAVGATDKSDNNFKQGNKAHQLKLLAPGVDIEAAVPGSSKTELKSGTSMAAPHVAGGITLLKEVRPKARGDEIIAALACGGTSIVVSDYDKPRIDLLRAYDFLIKPPTTKTAFDFIAASQMDSWQPLLGSWALYDGHYRPAPGGAQTQVSVLNADRCNGSAAYEARIKRANAGGGAYGFEGFLYKASIGLSTKGASGYLAFFTNNNGNNDFAGIVRLTNHKLTDTALSFNDTSFRPICLDNSPNQRFSDYNTLKVVNVGGKHTVYLNGSKACATFDFGYVGNHVALFSAPQYNAGDTVAFDYFKITPTDRAVPK